MFDRFFETFFWTDFSKKNCISDYQFLKRAFFLYHWVTRLPILWIVVVLTVPFRMIGKRSGHSKGINPFLNRCLRITMPAWLVGWSCENFKISYLLWPGLRQNIFWTLKKWFQLNSSQWCCLIWNLRSQTMAAQKSR